jgi:pimeloyl-ACP methyl ester carboxylesterase
MELRTEAIKIPVHGDSIEGTLIGPAAAGKGRPGTLLIHGWGGCQEQYLASARAIAALGYACLIFNLRGHAETRGQHESVTREDNLHDVIAAYDFLSRLTGIDRHSIAVVGASYGAYLGALLLYLRPVSMLALRAPALYKDDDWELPKRQLHVNPDIAAYRRLTLRAEDNRALGACAQFLGEALVVESEHDEIIPHPAVANYIAALANAHSLTYRVIEGADHGLTKMEWERAYTELLVGWLSEMVKDLMVKDANAQIPDRGAALLNPALGAANPAAGPGAATNPDAR